mmetsp:Transcript_30679/g.42736  ORF Transcript_30679/g.42736 Transcript_30679/m.42736 type:complete len:220 (+) Transcript_30679:802-1461(+)
MLNSTPKARKANRNPQIMIVFARQPLSVAVVSRTLDGRRFLSGTLLLTYSITTDCERNNTPTLTKLRRKSLSVVMHTSNGVRIEPMPQNIDIKLTHFPSFFGFPCLRATRRAVDCNDERPFPSPMMKNDTCTCVAVVDNGAEKNDNATMKSPPERTQCPFTPVLERIHATMTESAAPVLFHPIASNISGQISLSLTHDTCRPRAVSVGPRTASGTATKN